MTDTSAGTLPLLAEDFPAFDEAQWRQLVDKVLNGADFARKLVKTTADGIPVRPLYTAADGPFHPGVPGAAPAIRGASAAGSAVAGWDLRALLVADGAAISNRDLIDELERGATSVQLRLAHAGAAERVPDLL